MRALSFATALVRGQSASIGRGAQIVSGLIDLFLIFANGFLVFYFRFALTNPRPPGVFQYPLLGQYVGLLLLDGALIIALCHDQELYRPRPTWSVLNESFAVIRSVLVATVLLTVFIYLLKFEAISRFVIGVSAVMNALTLIAWRLGQRKIIEHRVARGIGTHNILIIGAGSVGQELARYFEANKQLGFVVKGFLDENHSGDSGLLGGIEDLPRIARGHFIDEVFITIPSAREVVRAVVLEARRHRIGVNVVPDLYDGLGWRAPIEFLGDYPIMSLHREPIPVLGLFLKRLADILVSSVGLILLTPFLVVIAIAIKLGSPGPVLYRSTRVGRKGRKFTFYKFRSMVQNTDAFKEELRFQNEREGPTFKITDDPRITRLGKSLRRYSLDELPQLLNVLTGAMSLVGPRPHPVDDFNRYALEHLRRLDVTPGITGLWQVSARRDPSFEKNLALDLEYIENWNLWLDLEILLRTVPAVLRGTGS